MMDRKWWTVLIGVSLPMAIAAMGAPLCAAADPGSQTISFPTGEWTWHDNLTNIVASFLPNGHYLWDMKTEGIDFPSKGTYSFAGSTLTLNPENDTPQKYQVQREGSEQMTLSGGIFPEARTFAMEPGSLAKVEAEEQKEQSRQVAAQATQAKVDAEWRKRIPLAPLNLKFPHGAVGAIPADTHPAHHFPHATVFKNVEGYTHVFMLGGVENGTSVLNTNSMRWFFFPDGRLYCTWSLHKWGDASLPSPGPGIGTWAAYKITPGETEDTVAVQTDQGEALTMKLEHGRRFLVHGQSSFEQVQASNQELDRILDSFK